MHKEWYREPSPILGPHWIAWQAWIHTSFKCVPKLLQHGSWKELVDIGELGEDHMWDKDGCFFFPLLQGLGFRHLTKQHFLSTKVSVHCLSC